jgi:divinyl protochlorophyllide a 8-vinyl-reductase
MTASARTSAPDASGGEVARIGPNAAIQLIAALRHRGEDEALLRLFRNAGLERWLDHPPERMIDQAAAARLHVGLRRELPPAEAEAALAEAGRLTAAYLLAHRIPRPIRWIFKCLPARLSASLLSRSIRRHAWTFAGAGRFEGRVGRSAQFTLHDNPLCAGERSDAPVCVWHAQVFEKLFRALVSPRARARETSCLARGDAFCQFEVEWAPSKRATPRTR